jgi:hypothetical protein
MTDQAERIETESIGGLDDVGYPIDEMICGTRRPVL